MATKQVGNGSSVQYTNSSGSTITADTVVVMGSNSDAMIGVVHEDILDTETGTVYTDGVFRLAAVSAAVIAQGEGVMWDSSASSFDDNQATPASGDVADAGIAMAASGNGDTTVDVWINKRPAVLS